MIPAKAKKEAVRIKREVNLPRAWKSTSALPYGRIAFYGDEYVPAWVREAYGVEVKLQWNPRLGFTACCLRPNGLGTATAVRETWREALEALSELLEDEARKLGTVARKVMITTTRS